MTKADHRLSPEAAARVAEGQAALNKALLNEDPLGMVIRAHIHIEKLLNDFLEARIIKSALDVLDLDYGRRVRLAVALGMPAEFQAALNFVGSLRNRFAHQLDASLTKQDAKNFAHALGPENREIAKQTYLRTRQRLAAAGRPDSIKKLEPRDQIIFYFVTIWTGLALVAAHASSAAGEQTVDTPHPSDPLRGAGE